MEQASTTCSAGWHKVPADASRCWECKVLHSEVAAVYSWLEVFVDDRVASAMAAATRGGWQGALSHREGKAPSPTSRVISEESWCSGDGSRLREFGAAQLQLLQRHLRASVLHGRGGAPSAVAAASTVAGEAPPALQHTGDEPFDGRHWAVEGRLDSFERRLEDMDIEHLKRFSNLESRVTSVERTTRESSVWREKCAVDVEAALGRLKEVGELKRALAECTLQHGRWRAEQESKCQHDRRIAELEAARRQAQGAFRTGASPDASEKEKFRAVAHTCLQELHDHVLAQVRECEKEQTSVLQRVVELERCVRKVAGDRCRYLEVLEATQAILKDVHFAGDQFCRGRGGPLACGGGGGRRRPSVGSTTVGTPSALVDSDAAVGAATEGAAAAPQSPGSCAGPRGGTGTLRAEGSPSRPAALGGPPPPPAPWPAGGARRPSSWAGPRLREGGEPPAADLSRARELEDARAKLAALEVAHTLRMAEAAAGGTGAGAGATCPGGGNEPSVDKEV